jgi:hypothetical protein
MAAAVASGDDDEPPPTAFENRPVQPRGTDVGG